MWSTSSPRNAKADPNAVFAGSVPYLMLAGNLVAGWQLARSLLVAEDLLAQGRGRGLHAGQDRHGALLRRAHAEQGAGHARRHRRRRRQRHGAGARSVLTSHRPIRAADVLDAAAAVLRNLPLPVIGSPLFIISNPKLVIEQCKAGIVGSMPALNARPASQLDEWLHEITETLAAYNRAHPGPAGGAVRHQPDRAQEQRPARARHGDGASKYKVPIIITSLGARTDVNDAVHGYGGIVLHDIINNTFARKAIEKGADGLIAVAAGAGGHAGVKSPFALVQEIRQWFDGPLALSGAIATGGAVLAAQAMGADFAYIGSAFIATEEARAVEAYKQAIVDGSSATTSSTRACSPACTATT